MILAPTYWEMWQAVTSSSPIVITDVACGAANFTGSLNGMNT